VERKHKSSGSALLIPTEDAVLFGLTVALRMKEKYPNG
jgi:hypothetical protein